MDKRLIVHARRLEHFGISREDAELLVAAGYNTPRKIKAEKASVIGKLVPKSRRGQLGVTK